MVTINTKTGQVTESEAPEYIVNEQRKTKEYKRRTLESHEKDLELIMASTNPEIQALCRVLGLNAGSTKFNSNKST